MASVLDLCAAWVIGSLIVRLDLGDLARPDVLLGTTRGLMAGAASAGVAVGLGPAVGLEFSGRPWRDGDLLGIAYGFEQATHHRHPPVLVEQGLLTKAR